MTRLELVSQIREKKSFLCVGLDTDIRKIPPHLLHHEDPVFEFNKSIIDATKEFCVAYKPNLAFYESAGPRGLVSLEKTMDYIPNSIFTIADAKRGDIGNTSDLYARSFFEHYKFDSITIAPYMGEDSIMPFLDFSDKWVILLALTSNAGAKDFQYLTCKETDRPVYMEVIRKSVKWAGPDRMMYVVGATKSEYLADIRKIIPDHFLLIPGVGAQGGDFEAVVKYGMNKDVGLLINSSRGIIYASDGEDFAVKAGEAASKIQKQMMPYLI